MDERENLKKTIKAIQKKYNLRSQRSIISNMGYSTWGYLSDLFSGKVPISDKFLAALEKNYNVNVQYVRTGEGDIFLPDPDPLEEPIELPGQLTEKELDFLFKLPLIIRPAEREALITQLDSMIELSDSTANGVERLKRFRLLLNLPTKQYQEQVKKLREEESARQKEQDPANLNAEERIRDLELIIDNMKKNIALLHLRFMSITEQTSRAQQIVNTLIYRTTDEELKKKLERLAECLVNIVRSSVLLEEVP